MTTTSMQGWLMKFSVGKSRFLGFRNWKERFFSTTVATLQWSTAPHAKEPKGSLRWDRVLQLTVKADASTHPSAADPDAFYFAIEFDASSNGDGTKVLTILLRASSSDERRQWCLAIQSHIATTSVTTTCSARDSWALVSNSTTPPPPPSFCPKPYRISNRMYPHSARQSVQASRPCVRFQEEVSVINISSLSFRLQQGYKDQFFRPSSASYPSVEFVCAVCYWEAETDEEAGNLRIFTLPNGEWRLVCNNCTTPSEWIFSRSVALPQSSIPLHILVEIFKFLTLKEICKCSLVCGEWYMYTL